MSLIVFGINHRTAPVELREKVSFSTEQLIDAYRSLHQFTGCQESVILSTCNRTEVYCYHQQPLNGSLLQWISEFHQLHIEQLQQGYYLFEDHDAIRHAMRVACGLDSMVLGEPQVLGQLKQAFAGAKNTGHVGANFERLFQSSFSVAKKVRTETDIGANAVSVAYSAVQLAKHIFGSLQSSRVLLIGAGETIELVGRHLKEQSVSHMRVANRTLSRGREVAEPLGADVMTLAQVPASLAQADIVISSTASQLPILGKGVVESALKERRQKPMLLVDLAVPRDIEPEVADLNDAYLYSVDDLQTIVKQNLQSRQQAANEAELMIGEQVDGFVQWSRSQASIDTLREYRLHSEQQRDKLQTRALNQLAEGQSAEKIIIELANKLTNSLIHAPTRAVKQAAEQGDQQRLDMLRDMLGLDGD